MIGARVSSQSCFCWVYRASISTGAKNIINVVLVLTIWWCSCVESSLVLLEKGACYDQCILGKTLLTFDLLCFLFQGQICLVLWYLLTSYFCIPVSYDENDIFFCVCVVLEGLVGLHRTVQLQLLQHYWSGNRLELLGFWMVALEMDRDPSVIFEIASKYYILYSFVYYDGYSISSKGVLPTVVDIMVIWVKFTHSSLL